MQPLMSALSRHGPKRRTSKWSRFALCTILSAVVLASLGGQEPLPSPTGFINDYVGVLDERVRANLEALARELQQTRGSAVAVLESAGHESLEDTVSLSTGVLEIKVIGASCCC